MGVMVHKFITIDNDTMTWITLWNTNATAAAVSSKGKLFE